jgi:hypothetical protein
MPTFRVEFSARVHAPADVVYRLIADYRDGHPRIVPPKYFSDLVVDEGGYGAGTRFHIDMTVLGTTRRMRAVVEEPQPGRVLRERDVDRGIVSTFEVVPVGGSECDVTIATELPDRGGIAGAVERFVSRRMLPRIYREELVQLERVALAFHRS